jgi:hypothetical protein
VSERGACQKHLEDGKEAKGGGSTYREMRKVGHRER